LRSVVLSLPISSGDPDVLRRFLSYMDHELAQKFKNLKYVVFLGRTVLGSEIHPLKAWQRRFLLIFLLKQFDQFKTKR
jgi:hypothetical protein